MMPQCKEINRVKTLQIRTFWARLAIFTVCGPQVDALIYCKRLKCPTFFKKPWSLSTGHDLLTQSIGCKPRPLVGCREWFSVVNDLESCLVLAAFKNFRRQQNGSFFCRRSSAATFRTATTCRTTAPSSASRRRSSTESKRLKTKSFIIWKVEGGRGKGAHSTEVVFALLTQGTQVRVPTRPIFFRVSWGFRPCWDLLSTA